ncbi:hypothetical protein ACO2Q0_11285 [Phenylobacterium sp. VNQ135]|uniref:hypothetical protein n=1 Tax=Phenylobacterium sp. VNQ135 TaxID=3400922 RepID=UPI003C012E87
MPALTSEERPARKPPQMTGCVCEQASARYTEFESRPVGCDETEGRFADVTIERCRSCGRLWLRYEYEAFSRSGRWARGRISDDEAATVTPETAIAYLNGLSWYLYGGSYFDGVGGRRSGAMRWNP